MLIRFAVIFVFLILVPIKSYAITFNCCECISKKNNKTFCVTTPTGKSCSFAANEINKKTNQEFEVSCDSLESNLCHKISIKPTAKCINDPVVYTEINKSFLSGGATDASEVAKSSIAPSLGVKIPGADFPEKLTVKNNKIQVPFLAIYIYALQRYLIGIGFIAAAIMLIYGGFLYIIASTGVKVSVAKDLIKDALLGLSILLASVVILTTINPNTTTNPTMEVVVVGKDDWPEDPVEGRKLVEEAATIKWDYSLPAYSSLATDSSGPITKVYIPPDAVVRNTDGLAVAQGVCPRNMIKIPYTEEYKAVTRVEVSTFCIDKFEAPNQSGRKPLVGMLNIEAAYWCDMHGKRLCTQAEWQRACRGPTGKNSWGIKGATSFTPGVYIKQGLTERHVPSNPPAPCNYDSKNPDFLQLIKKRNEVLGDFPYYPNVAEASIWVQEHLNSALSNAKYREGHQIMKKFLQDINSPVEISGSRITCQTDEGVFDMIGNVQEIVLAHRKSLDELRQIAPNTLNYIEGNKALQHFRWMNWYWKPVAHTDPRTAALLPTCNVAWGGKHAMGWRGFENGFRCCMDYSEPTTSTTLGIVDSDASVDTMTEREIDVVVPEVVTDYPSPPSE